MAPGARPSEPALGAWVKHALGHLRQGQVCLNKPRLPRAASACRWWCGPGSTRPRDLAAGVTSSAVTVGERQCLSRSDARPGHDRLGAKEPRPFAWGLAGPRHLRSGPRRWHNDSCHAVRPQKATATSSGQWARRKGAAQPGTQLATRTASRPAATASKCDGAGDYNMNRHCEPSGGSGM